MKTYKLQRQWDYFGRPMDFYDTDEDSMREIQRKAVFELLRDVTEYAKAHKNCRVKTMRLDPIGLHGIVGVEMEN